MKYIITEMVGFEPTTCGSINRSTLSYILFTRSLMYHLICRRCIVHLLHIVNGRTPNTTCTSLSLQNQQSKADDKPHKNYRIHIPSCTWTAWCTSDGGGELCMFYTSSTSLSFLSFLLEALDLAVVLLSSYKYNKRLHSTLKRTSCNLQLPSDWHRQIVLDTDG